jgi:hypothetical protein
MTMARTSERADGAAPSLQLKNRGAIVHLFGRAGAGYCVSTDPSGSIIPPGLNGERWVYVRDISLAPEGPRYGFDTALALDGLQQAGYFLIGGWYEAQ